MSSRLASRLGVLSLVVFGAGVMWRVLAADPPADKEYAVLPVGVATMRPSACISVILLPLPDISSVDAFRALLLRARGVAMVDPAAGGTSGVYLFRVYEKLGIDRTRPLYTANRRPIYLGHEGEPIRELF